MKQVDVQTLRQLMADGVRLVDVRERWEHAAFNIGGNNIPMGELMSRVNELPKDEPLIVYCEKGIRSVIAIQRLETMGYTNLVNLAGGMYAWKNTP